MPYGLSKNKLCVIRTDTGETVKCHPDKAKARAHLAALNANVEETEEARDYDKEYRDYHGKPDQIKNRASRNQARRKLTKDGRVKKGDGKDVDHKDGNPRNNKPSNLRVASKSANRARKEAMAKEAVSFDKLRDKIRQEIIQTLPVNPNNGWCYISELFDEYVIVETGPDTEYWQVPYTVSGDEVELADKTQWLKVEQERVWTQVTESFIVTPHLEAKKEGEDEKKFEGREWDVTIIGAGENSPLVEVEGREFIRSLNGRLYAVDALKDSAPLWENVKVYDNHLTQEEFEAKQGMRSPAKEWLGTIVKPKWDEKKKQLKGVFKVVEEALATKLKNAWDAGILDAIGLSIDTFPEVGETVMLEGQQMPIIEGFKKILSVDLVGDPAAGGGFNRLIASVTHNTKTEVKMTPEELKALLQEGFDGFTAALPAIVKPIVAEALAAEETPEVEAEETEEGDTPEAEAAKGKGKKKGKMPMMDDEEQESTTAEQAIREARLARCELMLERKLTASKLPESLASVVRQSFTGRIFEEKDLDAMIKTTKEAQASLDPSGRVSENGGQRQTITAGLNPDDKFAVEFMRLMMGNTEFDNFRRATEHHALVDERLQEFRRDARFLEAWEKDGKPEIRSFNRMSTLLEAWLGGNPLIDGRALEAASTSTLATVVKNTVNIMVAADYSKRELWYEAIVRVHEVDTIDDATLARLFGISSLPVVNEGAAYTELAQSDEEETAAFVKKGGYVGITLEVMMRDKLSYIRSIPMRMTNAWYNTLSDATAAVFTVNSNTGPVLSDSGALFNATAVASAGGHANLLTTALSYSAYSAGRTAMRKQTDQPSGAGRKLQITPKFLLVPEDLETTALTIRNSEYIPGSANNDVNEFYQKFEVIPVPSWTDANDWAQVADPAQFPAIWHIFPRGGRTPSLFTADSEVTGAMFTNDELRFKVRQTTYRFSSSYECSPVSDWRPLRKNNV